MNDARLKRHPFGFLRVADLPSPEELGAYYAKTYYQQERSTYRKSYPDDEIAYFRLKTGQHAELAQAARGSAAPGAFLDVGCGEGFALKWFEERGWDVDGLDFSSAGLEQINPDMLPFVETGDVFELLDARVAAGRKYDIVWLKHVLEHVREPMALLGSLRKIIDADGVLVVTVPNDGTWYQEHLFESGKIDRRFWIAIPDHLSYFNARGLTAAAEEEGWQVADLVGDFPIDFFLLHPGSNYVKDGQVGPAAHRGRMDFERALAEQPAEIVNNLYRAMAQAGIGRNLTALLKPL